MKKKTNFQVTNYKEFEDEGIKKLIIEGLKPPPPSKRITLLQKNLKVIDAR
jgi:hypothetical protein